MPQPKKQVIDIVYEIKKGQSTHALKIARQIVEYTKKIDGEEIHPYIVNLKTVPTMEREKLEQFHRGEMDLKTLRIKPFSTDTMADEDALDLLNHENIFINSSKNNITHWSNTAIIFSDRNGKIPDFIKGKGRKEVVLEDNEDNSYLPGFHSDPMHPERDTPHFNITNTEISAGSVGPNKGIKSYTYIRYPKHMLVLPPARKSPHPNTLAKAKRILVMDPKYLKKVVGKCNEDGEQTRFMLCQKCGSELQRTSVCQRCGSPLMLGKDKSTLQCTNRECKGTIKRKSVRPENRGKYACKNPNCGKVIDEEKFVSQQSYMVCTNCQTKQKHPRIVFVGNELQHLDIAKEIRKVRKSQ